MARKSNLDLVLAKMEQKKPEEPKGLEPTVSMPKKTNVPTQKIYSVKEMVDAPADWNKFPRIKDLNTNTYAELKYSILKNGVAEPIILWVNNTGKPMIISGHNRRDICLELYEENKENEDIDIDQWLYPTQKVYQNDELSEYQVKSLILDTNLASRKFEDIPIKTRIEILQDRTNLIYLNKNKDEKVESIQDICAKLGLKKSAIYEDITIAKMNNEIKQKYFDLELNRKQTLALASLEAEVQKYIADHILYLINSKTFSIIPKEIFPKKGEEKLTPSEKIKKLRKVFDASETEDRVEPEETTIVKIKVPKSYEKDLLFIVSKWKKQNGII